MDEAKRFIRYIIPAAVMVVELILFLGISFGLSGNEEAWRWLIGKIKIFANLNIGGSAFLGFLLVGTGAVLSLLYHALLANRSWGMSHQQLLIDSVEAGYLKFLGYFSGQEINPRQITCLGSWRIVNAYWHGNTRNPQVFKELEKRVDSLCHFAHGLGASFMGSVIVFFAWEYFYIIYVTKITKIYTNDFWGWFGFFYFFVIIHCVSWAGVLDSARSLIEQGFVDELRRNKKFPVDIYLTQREYTGLRRARFFGLMTRGRVLIISLVGYSLEHIILC